MPRYAYTTIAILFSLGVWSAVIAVEPTTEQRDFFEKKIRPVLVTHCYECHSAGAKKIQAGLLLDNRAGSRKGGETGPAVVPGEVTDSLLIDALRYETFEMPPKGKLSDAVIADFVKWIEMGAPDPRDGAAIFQARRIDIEQGRQHWAYQPPNQTTVPRVHDQTWPRNSIDQFILAKLEQHSLRPAPDADPELLIRRVYYDLAGLPPTPEEVDQFLNVSIDNRQSAFEGIVDRLLASPRFGERWGRHWLDVVRFGESNTLRGTVFGQAWRYRDYVIDAFNDDLPFNQFVLEQVAGDLLPGETWQQRRRQTIATAMLSLGNSNFENQDKGQLRMDVVDEQLEVVGRAFLAQTIACARCHDHKFDPIPTRDYYALAGILRNTKTLEHANVSRWIDVPLPSDPVTEEKLKRQAKAVKQLQQQIGALKRSLGAKTQQQNVGAKSVSVNDLAGIVVDDTKAKKQGVWADSTSSPSFVAGGYLHDGNTGKGQKSVAFETVLPADGNYEVRVTYSPGTNRATNTPVTVWSADGESTARINQRKMPTIDRLFVSLGSFPFRRAAPARVVIANDGTDGHVIADAVQFLDSQQLAKLAGRKPDAKKPVDQDEQAGIKASQVKLKTLETDLKKLQAAVQPRAMAMSVVEESEIGDTHIHVRGNVHNLGASVPRGFLQVLAYGSPVEFTERESGRRQLGQWLASGENPLTARVTVNRLWHWLFGAGLVRTTDNFGTVGERPSHPELLDFLARQFQHDWSVKSMLRQMVLSHTYQMSSKTIRPAFSGGAESAANVDVENRLLWRTNRRRLEAECIRDTMLVVSGELTLDMHGPTFPADRKADYDFHYDGLRRSVYAPVFRNSLLELFEVFDFADPSVVVGRRSVSTVAPQALFMMNNPLVITQSRRAAERLWAELPSASDATRIERAYRLALGRHPTATELRLATKFVGAADEETRLHTWGEFYQALFASLDFRYVD